MKPTFNKKCRLCPLHVGRKSVCVPGEGPLDSKFLIVGQAPGKTEDATGRPYVGMAGEILREAMRRAELTARIENAVRCWPPGDRVPRKEEVEACSPYLDRVIECMPNLEIVITLGNVATRRMTRKTGITKLRGTPLPVRWPNWTKAEEKRAIKRGDDIPEFRNFAVLPTYHPAFIVRGNVGVAEVFLGDIRTAKKLAEGLDRGMVKLAKGSHGAKVILQYARKTSGTVAFDLETTDLDPTKGSIISVSFYTGRGKPVSILNTSPAFLPALAEFYRSPVKKVVQGTYMEAMWGEFHLGVRCENIVADTMLMSKRVDNTRPANLATIGATYAKEVAGFKIDSETSHLQGEQWWELDPEELQIRNALDSYVTLKGYQKMAKKLGKTQMKIHTTKDIDIATSVGRMERRGLQWSRARVREWGELMKKERDKAERVCAKNGIHTPVSENEKVAQSLFDMGYDTGKWGARNVNTGRRQMSIDKDALIALITEFPEHREFLEPILDYRRAAKQMGTYVSGMEKRMRDDGMMNSRFFWPGAQSWRLSSSNPNFQNLPSRGKIGTIPLKQYRGCIISRYDGGNLVCSDYSQAELRWGALLSGDARMIRAFQEGEDIHGNTAAIAYGKKFTDDERSTAKGGNFELMYGGKAPTLAAQLLITLEEAKRIERAFQITYPDLWAFMRDNQMQAKRDRLMRSPFYEVACRFSAASGKRADEIARSGANFPIQFAASVMTLAALAKIDRMLDPRLGIVVLNVHDEIVADTPTDGREVGALMQEVMVETAEELAGSTVPFTVDTSIGPDWYNQQECE